MTITSLRKFLFKFSRLLSDAQAVRRGRIVTLAENRVIGRFAGKIRGGCGGDKEKKGSIVDKFAITRKLASYNLISPAERQTATVGPANFLICQWGMALRPSANTLLFWEYYRDLGIADRYGLDLDDLIQGGN